MPQSLSINAGYPIAGPYSKVVLHNDILYLSGIIPLDETGKQMVSNDTATQIQRVFAVLHDILIQSGSTARNCIEITVYLSSLDDFPLMNKIYYAFFEKYCPDGYLPARTTIQAGIYGGARIELQVKATAVLPSSNM